jgi:hypothetical protein
MVDADHAEDASQHGRGDIRLVGVFAFVGHTRGLRFKKSLTHFDWQAVSVVKTADGDPDQIDECPDPETT